MQFISTGSKSVDAILGGEPMYNSSLKCLLSDSVTGGFQTQSISEGKKAGPMSTLP